MSADHHSKMDLKGSAKGRLRGALTFFAGAICTLVLTSLHSSLRMATSNTITLLDDDSIPRSLFSSFRTAAASNTITRLDDDGVAVKSSLRSAKNGAPGTTSNGEDDGGDEELAPSYPAVYYNDYRVPNVIAGSSSSSSAIPSQHQLQQVIQWRPPGRGAGRTDPMRLFTEVLAFGLGGVLPWYGARIPALWFQPPYKNDTTSVQIAVVPDLVLVTMDLHQCGTKGFFDVCFQPSESSLPTRAFCFDAEKRQSNQNRIRNYPSPGHERFSCHDETITNELVAAMVLDYLLQHLDRFYPDRTNNLFFVRNKTVDYSSTLRDRKNDNKNDDPTPKIIPIISIDHHANAKAFFQFKTYENFVRQRQPLMLQFDLPAQLRNEIRSLRSAKDLYQKLNAILGGEMDHVCRVANELSPNGLLFSLKDMLWRRLESVAKFYNFTIERQE